MSERVLPFDAGVGGGADAGALGCGARGVETVELLAGAGRVLAAAVVADRDQPAFDRATRDGYAVRAGGCWERAAGCGFGAGG